MAVERTICRVHKTKIGGRSAGETFAVLRRLRRRSCGRFIVGHREATAHLSPRAHLRGLQDVRGCRRGAQKLDARAEQMAAIDARLEYCGCLVQRPA